MTLNSSGSSCFQLNVVDDHILEIDENITLSVSPSPEDSAVIVISTLQNYTKVTIEDDDSK